MERTEWPKASLIISNFNGKEMLRECLRSLEKLQYPDYEIIVVDAGSTDGSADLVRSEFPDVRLLREKKIGIGEAINKGLMVAHGDIIAIDLNNDEVFSQDWLIVLVNELLSSEERKVVGGVRVVYESNGIIDAAGGQVGYTGLGFVRGKGKSIKDLPQSPSEVTYLGTMIFQKELLKKIGMCDEKYYLRTEDWDFCEKARRAGYKIVSVPSAMSYHRRSATIKSSGVRNIYYSSRNRVRLYIKHYPLIRMIFALLVWAAYMVANSIQLFFPTRKILLFLGFEYTHLFSRQSSELFTALLKSLWWNLENLRDHFKARKVVQSIEAQ